MRKCVQTLGFKGGSNGTDIDACGGQQIFAQAAVCKRAGRVPGKTRYLDNLANKRIPVGMRSAGGKTQQNVARADVAGQRLAALHRADGEPREVKVVPRVHAGHFCRLAANQRGVRLFAARRNPGYNVGRRRDVKMTGREIIQEKQRLGPLADQIVDAHRHQINPHSGQVCQLDGNAQLRSDAIGCSH